MRSTSELFNIPTIVETPEGMSIKDHESDWSIMTLSEPIGQGEMILKCISPWFVAARIDFSCDYCPNMKQDTLQQGHGRWLSINYCEEGRCEVDMGSAGCAVVKAADLCISSADRWPDGFRYPSGRYRGIELWINTDLLNDPSFQLLAEAGISLNALAVTANPASAITTDASLSTPMKNIGDALGSNRIDDPLTVARCKGDLISLLLAVADYDLANTKPPSLLSPRQLRVIRSIGESIRQDPAATYDARVLAKDAGISASTLNAWFASLYGKTVSAYVRYARMELAAMLLAKGKSVAETSLEVGYANPSKFAAVFKKERGMTPSEFRQVKSN